jgi:hypothetical protein
MKRTRLEFWVLHSWRVRVPFVSLLLHPLPTPNPEGPRNIPIQAQRFSPKIALKVRSTMGFNKS